MTKLQLYKPVRPWIVTQKFGETKLLSYYKENGVFFNGHNGMDIACEYNSPIYASHEGVVEVQVDVNQGYGVVVISENTYDYKDGQAHFKTIYWHMINSIQVKTGQKVKAGDLLGYADSTGLSTGNHLHYGLKPMGKNLDGTYYNLEPSNGYTGAIDPEPYLIDKYAEDIKYAYLFERDLQFGQSSEEIRKLQTKLQKLGYFPSYHESTQFYGFITKNAVFAFQQECVPNLSWYEKLFLRGSKFGEKSRTALNKL